MTTFSFPLHVSVSTGEKLEPTGLDPYALPWVQGAAQTLPTRTRRRYPGATTDLREKLSLLKTKRAAKTVDDPPIWGPALRPGYRSLAGRPLATTKDGIGDGEADNR